MGLSKKTALRFIEALDQECQRTMQHLKVPGYPRLFYLSYLLRDIHTTLVWGRLGNINNIDDKDSRNLYCDCRVGGHRYDQVSEGGLEDNDQESETYDHVEMPIGNDSDALKYHVWKLTDSRYREAVQHYLHKRSHHITYRDQNQGLASFVRAKPQVDLQLHGREQIDLSYWKDYIKRASRIVKDHPEVKNSWVEVRIRDVTRLFVNSEGSKLIDQSRTYELGCELWLLAKNGEGVSTRISHLTPSLAELPSLRDFSAEIRQRIKLLQELAAAPTLKSYAGPVLLAPVAAGILIHEVLGHRLEGSRLLSTKEGQTFKRDLGKQILPPLLSLYDDPTLTEINGVRTVGAYRYDDEGSPAQRAELVREGKLVGFLGGRAPFLKRLKGNGHARSEYHERPISRMANLVVSSKEGLSHEALKARFLEQIRSQKLPFGIMILDAEGGETATEAYDFQAFMGTISLAVQVWADGRENLLHNVSFVGTPLSALRTLTAVGDTSVTQNAFCGAESGVLPVSTTCPAILLSNLELQASDQRKFLPYVLPMPFEEAVLKRRAAVSRQRPQRQRDK